MYANVVPESFIIAFSMVYKDDLRTQRVGW